MILSTAVSALAQYSMVSAAAAVEYLSAYVQFRLRGMGVYVDTVESDFLAHQWNGSSLAQVNRYLAQMVYENEYSPGTQLTFETLMEWAQNGQLPGV